jgi:hypothetical protein
MAPGTPQVRAIRERSYPCSGRYSLVRLNFSRLNSNFTLWVAVSTEGRLVVVLSVFRAFFILQFSHGCNFNCG